jgi:hypothetical protein
MSVPLGFDNILFILKGFRGAFRIIARPFRGKKLEEESKRQR